MEWLKGGEQMAYYHILRQRRQDLNLSIEYVSSQTRLAPQYIQAIEQHNLDVFSDDFSFVRYFVHAYCDAIGVNWVVIKDEVDADINAYARQRSMALSQAQKKLIAQIINIDFHLCSYPLYGFLQLYHRRTTQIVLWKQVHKVHPTAPSISMLPATWISFSPMLILSVPPLIVNVLTDTTPAIS